MRRRPLVRRLVSATAVAVILAAAGGGAWIATHSSGPTFVTGVAQRGTVDQALTLTGTIEPVDQADIDFPVAGTVATVNVAVGERVTAGSLLATLQTAPLTAELDKAESTLLSDQARLSTAESPPATTSAGSAASPSGTGASTGSAQVSTAETQLSAEERIAAQAGTSEKAALLQAEAACEAAGLKASTSGTSATSPNQSSGAGAKSGSSYPAITTSYAPRGTESKPTTTSTSTSTPTTTTPTTTTPTTTTPTTTTPTTLTQKPSDLSQANSACLAGMVQASANELRLSTDQQSVASAENALAGALTKSTKAAQAAGPKIPTAAAASPTGASVQPSAATLASDQAAVDSAEAQLGTAAQALAASRLLAPVSGTVALVNVVPNEHVLAGATSVKTGASNAAASSATALAASSAQVVIVSDSAMEVQAALSTTQVGQVKVADPATVLPAGSSTPIRATVVQLDLAGVESTATPAASATTTAVTFPATLALQGDPSSQGLRAGMSASVSVIIAQSSNTITVPTSAVHTFGSRHFVYEVHNGKEVVVPVDLGAMGDSLTQITSGVELGDRVVLADLRTPIPASGLPTTRLATRALSGGGGGAAFFRAAPGAGTGAAGQPKPGT
jgi:multidrug efflux pump subunit AcrA (membrane-fusion protein)